MPVRVIGIGRNGRSAWPESANGNWVGTGPDSYLLKEDANSLCLSCHNGQVTAPDVLGINTNTGGLLQGRSAGALNDSTVSSPYESWKGHTLGMPVNGATNPPGFDPASVGLSTTWFQYGTTGLRCIDCHNQHGSATAYRNLGPSALGACVADFQPTYVMSTTNDGTKDVWINISSTYTANSGVATTFNAYYSSQNVLYNRNDSAQYKTSNRIDTLCAACHGTFHGSPGAANIGATAGNLSGFLRHPTSQVTIGASLAQGKPEHSLLSQYANGTNKVKVYAAYTDATTFANPTPGCVSCHKAHGNQNPYGLILMQRTGTVTEEGTTTDVKTGYIALCGNCHTQVNP